MGGGGSFHPPQEEAPGGGGAKGGPALRAKAKGLVASRSWAWMRRSQGGQWVVSSCG